MSEDYLRGLKDALAAAQEAGPTALACMATAKLRDLVEAEDKRLAPIRRRAAQRQAALAPEGRGMTAALTADTWRPVMFFRAMPGAAPVADRGYEFRGMVLRHARWVTPRTETRWTLLHIGSGGAVARFTGNVATVFPVAAEIASCADWTLFDMPDGWRQTDPDLPAKVAAIIEAHPEARPEPGYDTPQVSADDARAVIDAREAGNG